LKDEDWSPFWDDDEEDIFKEVLGDFASDEEEKEKENKTPQKRSGKRRYTST